LFEVAKPQNDLPIVVLVGCVVLGVDGSPVDILVRVSLSDRRLCGLTTKNYHHFSPVPEIAVAAPKGEVYGVASTSIRPWGGHAVAVLLTPCVGGYIRVPF
jgi:hypothetical protein